MSDWWWLILILGIGTFAMRIGGVMLGSRLPRSGTWVRGFNALPGTLITALLAVQMLHGSWPEWIAAALALCTAFITRNMIATMTVGVALVWVLRQLL